MKSLKAKNFLFSLLTILAITVSLTSCEQETIAIPDAEVMEMTALEHPASITENADIENRSCNCDVWVGDITVTNLTATRKMFVVDTGIYTPGCTRNNFFWYTYPNDQPGIVTHWENDQAMSASFPGPGSYWVGAYLNAKDSDGDWCYDYSAVKVTIP